MNEIENTTQQIESYDNPIVVEKIAGLSKSKSYLGWLQGRINVFQNRNNLDVVNILETCLEVHNKFYPKTKVTIPIKQFKGISGLDIKRFPNYFQTIEHRKKEINGEIEIIEERHKITREQLEPLINAIRRLILKKKYKTKYIAQEYLKMAKIEQNSKERRFFDDKGFNFAMFSGSRDIYIPFNIMLKILNYFDYIHYYKSGCVERLKDSFDIQIELPKSI